MKTRISVFVVVFIGIFCCCLVGCNSGVKEENEALRSKQAILQQKLEDASTNIEKQKPVITNLTAELNANKILLQQTQDALNAARSNGSTQAASIESLSKQLSESQKDREKLNKMLESYRKDTSSALLELKGLRSILEEPTLTVEDFTPRFLTAKSEVVKMVDALPDSKVKRTFYHAFDEFSYIKIFWEATIELKRLVTRNAEREIYNTRTGQSYDMLGKKPEEKLDHIRAEKRYAEKSNEEQDNKLRANVARLKGSIDADLHAISEVLAATEP